MDFFWLACYNCHGPGYIGTSPSGKALGFGPSIRRFESCRPSQEFLHLKGVFLFVMYQFVLCLPGLYCNTQHRRLPLVFVLQIPSFPRTF